MSEKSIKPAIPVDVRDLQALVETLQLELTQKNLEMAQKDLLVNQGHQAFLQAAEKLQESYKRLQQEVAGLNLELDKKNKALEGNLSELESVKNYLSNIFESQANGVFVTDLEGRVRRVNRAGMRLLGAAAKGCTGAHINAVLKHELHGENALACARSGATPGEQTLTFPRENEEQLTLKVAMTAITGENEEPQGYIVNVQDVTQLKKLEAHAARRDRFTAMGEMAANMAHEIRNPLGSIELFASLVKKGLPSGDDKLEYINHISSGVVSMNHIISNLLEYTKPRPVSLQKIDLHALVEDTAAFTRFRASQHQVRMELNLQAQPCTVEGDAELLKQVLHNLILNAIQAMPEGGHLAITSAIRQLSEPALLARLGRAEGASSCRVVELRCRDEGAGMDEEIRKQIFDPFFTTKARGTGLGLAIVHNIVESHHALIDIESRQGQGTEVMLMFPSV